MNRLRSLVSSNTVSLYSYVPHTASIVTRRHAARKRCALINRCLGAWPADSFCRPDHQGIRCRQSGWLGGAGHAVEGESLHARPRSRCWRCDGVCVCRLELAAEKQRGLAGAAFGCPTRRCVWLALGLTKRAPLATPQRRYRFTMGSVAKAARTPRCGFWTRKRSRPTSR